jgi:peroxiredoxin
MSFRTIPAALVVALCSASPLAHAEVRKGDRAAELVQVSDAAGKTISLGRFKDKVVVLTFGASWCEPCKKELPLLAKMAPKLRSEGVEIVTVNIDDNQKNAEAFLKQHGIQLTVVSDNDKHIVGKYEPAKMPSSFAIDKSGVVRAVNAGFEPVDEGKIEHQLLDLTKK